MRRVVWINALGCMDKCVRLYSRIWASEDRGGVDSNSFHYSIHLREWNLAWQDNVQSGVINVTPRGSWVTTAGYSRMSPSRRMHPPSFLGCPGPQPLTASHTASHTSTHSLSQPLTSTHSLSHNLSHNHSQPLTQPLTASKSTSQ